MSRMPTDRTILLSCEIALNVCRCGSASEGPLGGLF
jgi:hypothetical protein